MRAFLLVGLTGGIATGKSTVSEMFRALGCVIIDADRLAREIVEPGQPAYADIVAEFGPDVVQDTRALDRKRLGAIVFANPERRLRLEAITHPRIREQFAHRLQELTDQGFDGIVIFDAPVMIESGSYRNMDRLVVVATDETTQRARLRDRDQADDLDVSRRIGSQMPLAEKVKLADYVIDNTGERSATADQVRRVHAALVSELRARRRDRAP
jgi:dephospho-CoA kinase